MLRKSNKKSSKDSQPIPIKIPTTLSAEKLKRLKEFKPNQNDASGFALPNVKIQYSEPAVNLFQPVKNQTLTPRVSTPSQAKPVSTVQPKSVTPPAPVLAKVTKTYVTNEDILQQINLRLSQKQPKQPEINILNPETALPVPVKIISYKYYVEKPLPIPTTLTKTTKKPRTGSKRSLRKYLVAGMSVIALGILIGTGTSLGLNNTKPTNADAAVLGTIVDSVGESIEDSVYASWISDKNNTEFSPKDADLDNDGLTNYEEYTLDTNPVSMHTCNPSKTDSENIIELIDPKTCNSINTENDNEFSKFSQIINLDKLQQRLLENIQTQQESAKPVDEKSLLSIFGVSNFTDLDKISVTNLEQDAQNKDLKVKYLRLINRIDDYINKNRSYEIYDRDYETPVHAATYLQVSLKYNVPVKYLLAIARAESRFGTDRYTQSGKLTRPGEHRNIFSMGLTDSGSNITFKTWEDGVESAGKWWKRFDDRGVSVERRLKIYNPNGDYPTKIQGLANQIDTYINS